MEAVLVLGATYVIALAIINLTSFVLALFGGHNLVEKRKRGNNP